MAPLTYRGLKKFVEEVKACKSTEAEALCVHSEMAKIRAKFGAPAPLKAYDLMKYLWKLVYCVVLGYDVDFGQLEAIKLMASSHKEQKAVGYLACSVLVSPDEAKWRRLYAATVMNDVSGECGETASSLALAVVANSGSLDFFSQCIGDARRMVVDEQLPLYIVRRAALCVARLGGEDDAAWAVQVEKLLRKVHLKDDEASWGVALSLVTMVSKGGLGLVRTCHGACADLLVEVETIRKPSTAGNKPAGSSEYHGVTAPWLRIALLRALSRLDDQTPTARFTALVIDSYTVLLQQCLTQSSSAEVVVKVRGDANKGSAHLAVLIEFARYMLLAHNKKGPLEARARLASEALLFFATRQHDANARAGALQTAAAMCLVDGGVLWEWPNLKGFELLEGRLLNDADLSIRSAALTVLRYSCDARLAQRVLGLILQALTIVVVDDEDDDDGFKFRLALAEAALDVAREHLVDDPRAYVATAITLLSSVPSTTIWRRAATHVLAFTEEARQEAAELIYAALDSSSSESLICLAALVQAENTPNAGRAADYLTSLDAHSTRLAASSQAALLSCFAKIAARHANLAAQVVAIFNRFLDSHDTELQTRACEYKALLVQANSHTDLQAAAARLNHRRKEADPFLDLFSVDNDSLLLPTQPPPPPAEEQSFNNPFDAFEQQSFFDNNGKKNSSPYALFVDDDSDDHASSTAGQNLLDFLQ